MTTTKQRLVLAFSSVLVGCGATMPRLAAQSFPPNPTAPRWEQFCDAVPRNNFEFANGALQLRGRAGFEFVSMMLHGDDNWICFKRPAAR